MMRPTIITIVGESGSGKTFASMYLQDIFNWKAIVSYTTRPMREGEIQGREHWFVDKSEMPAIQQMCAYTFFGGYHYWTTWDQIFNNRHTTFVYVIDEDGLKMLEESPVQVAYNLIKVKIKRPDKTGIAQERRNRDDGMFTLRDSHFDYIIKNDGTIDQFKATLYITAECIKERINGNTK